MWTRTQLAIGAFALLSAGTSGASAHDLYEARESLADRGFYNIHVERASLPYSFLACKRGQRFHVHVGYYGEIQELDPIGYCGGYGFRSRYSGYYGERRYFEPGFRRHRDRYEY